MGAPTEPTIRALARLFRAPGHVFSYSCAFVAARGDEVLGLYAGMDDARWDEVFRATTRFNAWWLAAVPPWRLVHFWRALRDLYTGPDELPPAYQTGDRYYIEWLAVMPHARRQGVASRLLDFAAEQARAQGLGQLALEVLIENEGAQRFYEAYGFRQVRVTTDDVRFSRRYGSQGYILLAKPLV
ncbi:MAG: GNAT family N-acetyltransferase [Anaerolineae bacterium]|nr:GNAT family N-acetyltransferase [Anaerolineae bacterium]